MATVTTFIVIWALYIIHQPANTIAQIHWSGTPLDIARTSRQCEDAYYMLINSFATSCCEAWENVEAMLSDGKPRSLQLQDMCSTYCLNPLKTATEMCSKYETVYKFVLGLCCKNERGENCLSTFLTLNESFPPHSCQNLFHSNTSCPNNCSASLNTTLHTMGCCYNLILNNTAYTSTTNISASFSSDYWNNCGIHPPSDHCVCTYSSIGGTYSLQSNNFVNNLILLLLLLATSNII